ncbi:hypothetical protein Indivirus_16_1, partial [Indivirus ILV1]
MSDNNGNDTRRQRQVRFDDNVSVIQNDVPSSRTYSSKTSNKSSIKKPANPSSNKN